MCNWIQYPNLTFNEEKHVYLWNNVPVIGSTSVLSSVATLKKRKDGTEDWNPIGYSRFARSEDAANFGKAFHKICQIEVVGGDADYPEIMQPWVDQFHLFNNKYKLLPYEDKNGVSIVEYPMYSERYGYAGTPDFFGWINYRGRNVLALIDWKSSTSSQIHWRWQIASYIQLCKEVLKIKEKVIGISVRFDEDYYEVDIRDTCPEDWIGFQSVLNVFKMAA